ncbi:MULTISPECIES: LacI family DNA-binding transcriptional regulator [unclassified Clostridioides]|uniref:LacI family DNA-binding transcriptional regulator n=1 Tax=unclassified Clostridioides TaxID=2635829 RepID=UPI001D0FC170|nr:LacI family DNA-binding transcriptional regulator [Clostridioides sp. ES-S-0171-01]MCC0687615.1 LacI family DNA-binding transcriptional regulator [Clostridioides sp. ES-S-0056-01]MCC0714876.1 LacI family DNA-binding transcriptional regulator [Clostridioides sp. ES-S-0077-01]UDN53649.1 LacI family DNA-binding transcriptional regulator [Clostridioides sp. ES-S-0054-01]
MRRVTMKDISNKLDISINAVSLALNNKVGVSEETRKMVLNVAEELGYLEKSPKFVKSYAQKNICVIIKKIYFEDNTFYSKVMKGISDEASKNNYDIITCIKDDSKNIPSCVETKKVCGVVVIGTIDDDYLFKLKQYNIPVVLVDHTSLLYNTDSILTDNKMGSFKITKLLFDKGYEKIGFFGDLEYSLSVKERYFGYKEAIKKFAPTEINVKETIHKYSILSDIEEYILNGEHKKIQEIIKNVSALPDAFVCSNDNAAIMLITSLTDLGYNVPKDIAVVGFDDIAMNSLLVPKLTTVRVNKELMGIKAVKRLLWRLNNKKEMTENLVMGVDVIERASC